MVDRKPCPRCGGPKGTAPSRQKLCPSCHGTCSVCGAEPSRDSKGMYRPQCEPCRWTHGRRATCCTCGGENTGSHPSYCSACWRTYRRERERKRALANPEKAAAGRRQKLKSSYGLTPEEWQSMSDTQEGRCAVCARVPSGTRTRLCVDHCHTTGRIRQLLCNRCNMAIGLLDENPVTLASLARYLAKHAEPSAPMRHAPERARSRA